MDRARTVRAVSPWFSLFSPFGLLGFLPKHDGSPNYFFFIFFGFLAFFFWHLLEKGGVDERLLSNRRRAGMLLLTFFTLLSFLLLFLLDWGVGADAVLLVGSLGYALGMILSPVLTLVLDRAVD